MLLYSLSVDEDAQGSPVKELYHQFEAHVLCFRNSQLVFQHNCQMQQVSLMMVCCSDYSQPLVQFHARLMLRLALMLLARGRETILCSTSSGPPRAGVLYFFALEALALRSCFFERSRVYSVLLWSEMLECVRMPRILYWSSSGIRGGDATPQPSPSTGSAATEVPTTPMAP